MAYSYDRDNFQLNGYDTIAVYNSDTVLIDTVTYDTSDDYPVANGTTLNLASLDATDNNSALYWCTSTSSFGDGDLGTPGAANDNCNPTVLSSSDIESLSAGGLVISEIMHFPTAVPCFRGEWFEVYNNSGVDINLNGLQVSGSGSESFVVDLDVPVPAGEYAIFASRSYSNGIPVAIDYQYQRSNLKLDAVDRITLSNNGGVIDDVVYTPNAGFPNEAGKSLSLDVLNANSNDSSTSWCSATSNMGAGDLGTPGSANDACN